MLRLVLEELLGAVEERLHLGLSLALRVPVQILGAGLVPPHRRVDKLELKLFVNLQQVVALAAHHAEPLPRLRSQLVLLERVE